MSRIELLSPAGDMNKLKTAFYYGADAVYIGGKSMSLRALAGNFTNEEIIEATEYAHRLGKKVYVTVNIFGRNSDIEKAKEPLYTTRPEWERSGMGFTFMETFMDHLYVESSLGEGTLIVMEKQIGTQKN